MTSTNVDAFPSGYSVDSSCERICSDRKFHPPESEGPTTRAAGSFARMIRDASTR